jgi:hypothetical protein
MGEFRTAYEVLVGIRDGNCKLEARGLKRGGNIKLGLRVSIRYIVRFLNMVMNIQFLLRFRKYTDELNDCHFRKLHVYREVD